MAPKEHNKISRMSVANFVDFFLRMSEEPNFVVSGMRLLLAFYWAKLSLASSKERKKCLSHPQKRCFPLVFPHLRKCYPIYHLKHSQLVLLISPGHLAFFVICMSNLDKMIKNVG